MATHTNFLKITSGTQTITEKIIVLPLRKITFSQYSSRLCAEDPIVHAEAGVAAVVKRLK